MKSGFILTLFALGILICATCADPISSKIQQDDDSSTSKEEILNLLDHIARSQQDGILKESAEAQFFGKLLSKGLRFFKKHRRGITKGGGRLLGGALSGYTNPGHGGCGGGYKTAERQEQVLEAQEDNDGEDAKFQAYSEALKELEDLITEQQDDEDEDALAEIEELNSNLIATQEADDSLAKSTQDDNEDDAELQRRRKWRGRGRRGRRRRGRWGRRRWGRRRGRGGRGRGGRGRGGRGRGGGWSRIFGNLFGGLLNRGGVPPMGGGYPPMGGGYPPTGGMGGVYPPGGVSGGQNPQDLGNGVTQIPPSA